MFRAAQDPVPRGGWPVGVAASEETFRVRFVCGWWALTVDKFICIELGKFNADKFIHRQNFGNPSCRGIDHSAIEKDGFDPNPVFTHICDDWIRPGRAKTTLFGGVESQASDGKVP